MTPRVLGLGAAESVLRVIEASSGRVDGRTTLHKLAFLLKAKGVAGFEQVGFSYEPYGPSSRELADALQSLVSGGLVRETAHAQPDGSVAFTYDMTEAGRALLREFAPVPLPPDFDTAARQEAPILELAATVVFLERGRRQASRADALAHALELNPARAAYAERARRVLDAMQL